MFAFSPNMRDTLLRTYLLQTGKELAMEYDELDHEISDLRQNLRVTRRDTAHKLKQCIDNARGFVTVSDELTKRVADLSELDPQAHGMSVAEYAYVLILVYHQSMIEQAYVGIDSDNREGITFIIQSVK